MYEIVLFFSVFCFVGVTAAFVRSSAFSAFHPLTFYLAFHGFIFVFRPIFVYAMDYNLVYRIYQFVPSLSDKIIAILVSTFGMLVFAAVCWRAGNLPMKFKLDKVAAAERTRLAPLFCWIAALCVPIGIYSLVTVWDTAISTGSAYSNVVRNSSTRIAYSEGTNGYLLEAQLMLASCAVIFAWLFRFRIYAFLPLVLFAVYRAGIGGRGPIIAALATALLFYLYDRRRRLPSALALTMVPLVLIAFTAIGDDRGAAIRGAISNDASSEVFGRNRDRERFLEGMDFANLEYLEYVIYVVPQRSQTYGYFNTVLQVFTEPVPRALWPDKPFNAPFDRINMFDYGNPVGMTRSLPGEGWFSLGWAGVAIWCGLWGWLLGTLYRRFVEGPQSNIQVAAYMIFLSMLIVAFRDGQLVTVFRQGLFFMAPIVLWWLLARLVGVPKIGAVRLRLARRAKQSGTGRSSDAGERSVSAQRTLPSAVRRRLALASAAEDPSNTP